jgi:octaprenyl-diphosphate synthase
VFELIRADLDDFETQLGNELRSSVAFIEAIGEDLVAAGGKRLRPSLAFLAGRLLDAPREQALQVALAVELLHSASLLHDDLIDDANTRRGVDAAFRRYGNVVSVMSGDFMLARTLGILARSKSPEFTLLMSETAARICEAEVLQFQMATLETYSLENYFTIIDGKTAALLAAALEGVALLTGAPETERRALRAFGMHYGRAFQLQDDYLDLLGDPAVLGKPVGGDLREGKATFAVLELLAAGVDEARVILRRHASEDGDLARMRALIVEQGADRRAQLEIAREMDAAVACLERFPAGEAKAALALLAERELARVG